MLALAALINGYTVLSCTPNVTICNGKTIETTAEVRNRRQCAVLLTLRGLHTCIFSCPDYFSTDYFSTPV